MNPNKNTNSWKRNRRLQIRCGGLKSAGGLGGSETRRSIIFVVYDGKKKQTNKKPKKKKNKVTVKQKFKVKLKLKQQRRQSQKKRQKAKSRCWA